MTRNYRKVAVAADGVRGYDCAYREDRACKGSMAVASHILIDKWTSAANEIGSSGMAVAMELTRNRSCAVCVGHSIEGERFRNHVYSRFPVHEDSHLGYNRREVGRDASLEHTGNVVDPGDAYLFLALEDAGGPAWQILTVNGGNSIG